MESGTAQSLYWDEILQGPQQVSTKVLAKPHSFINRIVILPFIDKYKNSLNMFASDNEPMQTQRKLDIRTGPYYWFGGGLHGEPGYIGM